MNAVARAFDWLRHLVTTASAPLKRPPETGLSFDLAFDLLANSRRRGVIDYLADADDEPVPLKPVATTIAQAEEGCPDVHPSTQAYKRVYTSLLQTHLPRLDDAGVIEFDSSRTHLWRGPEFPFIADLQAEARRSFEGDDA